MNSPAADAPAPAAKPRKPRYPATVNRVETLTPRMVRVTFTSPELADFGWNGPAAHIKLIFGAPAPPAAAGAEPRGPPCAPTRRAASIAKRASSTWTSCFTAKARPRAGRRRPPWVRPSRRRARPLLRHRPCCRLVRPGGRRQCASRDRHHPRTVAAHGSCHGVRRSRRRGGGTRDSTQAPMLRSAGFIAARTRRRPARCSSPPCARSNCPRAPVASTWPARLARCAASAAIC